LRASEYILPRFGKYLLAHVNLNNSSEAFHASEVYQVLTKKVIIKFFKRSELILIALFLITYTIAASLVSLHRFWQFNAFWYDFGIFDTAVWKLSRFSLPTIEQIAPSAGRVVWGDHFNPSSAILAPLYWINSSPEIILVAQVLFTVASALVFYLLARKQIQSFLARIALVIAYLGFVGMQNALFTDVHNIVFALLPMSFTFWAIYEKRKILYWIFLVLTLGFQESMASFGFALGLFLIIKERKVTKLAIYTITLSLIWGIATTRFVMPFFLKSQYPYKPDIPLSPISWLKELVFPLNLKLKAIIVSFATFGFLPLFSLAGIPLYAQHFIERFVLNGAATRWDLALHYNATLSPILTVGAIEVIKRVEKIKHLKKYVFLWAAVVILLVAVIHRFYYHGPLLLATDPIFYKQTENALFLKNFVQKIPREGLLMTQNNLAAYFTHQAVILLNENYKEIKPDYIAIDLRTGQNANNFFPFSEEKAKLLINEVQADSNYEKILDGDQLLFKKTGQD